jgi:hypothetical protein
VKGGGGEKQYRSSGFDVGRMEEQRGASRDSLDVALALSVAAPAPSSAPCPALPFLPFPFPFPSLPSPAPVSARHRWSRWAGFTVLAGWRFCLPCFLRYYLRALAPPLLRYIVAVHHLSLALPLLCDGVPSGPPALPPFPLRRRSPPLPP